LAALEAPTSRKKTTLEYYHPASPRIRLRKKVAPSKFAEVTKHLNSQLEKGTSVVIDCFFLNEGKKAAVCTLYKSPKVSKYSN
jgi:hypothetical protein